MKQMYNMFHSHKYSNTVNLFVSYCKNRGNKICYIHLTRYVERLLFKGSLSTLLFFVYLNIICLTINIAIQLYTELI